MSVPRRYPLFKIIEAFRISCKTNGYALDSLDMMAAVTAITSTADIHSVRALFTLPAIYDLLVALCVPAIIKENNIGRGRS